MNKMSHNPSTYWENTLLFLKLIKKEAQTSLSNLQKKWLQASVSITTMFFLFAYLMPQMGLQKEYAPFIVVGLIAGFGFYEMVGKIAAFIADLNGERSFSYLLTLPLPAFLTISSIAIGWSISGTCLTLLLFPFTKILLGSHWNLSLISPFKFLLIVTTINLFFGYFALWIASLIKHVQNTGWLWIMIINPLYMLGGYYCPWNVTMSLSKKLAILALFNPMTYVMEGIRSATLGADGYLPFWICFFLLWIFIPLFSIDGYFRLKRRLDFI